MNNNSPKTRLIPNKSTFCSSAKPSTSSLELAQGPLLHSETLQAQIAKGIQQLKGVPIPTAAQMANI